MKRLQFIALVAAVTIGMTTSAFSTTWRDIRDTSYEERMAYYVGLDDAYDMWSNLYRMKRDDRYCIPDNTSYDRIFKVAEKFIKNDRSAWDEELSFYVYASWVAKWPCR